MDRIELPDSASISKTERGDWVCYYKQGASHAKDFHELLKRSGIISLGPNNYKDPKKVYYVTKFGGVFSVSKKDFNDVKAGILTLSRYITNHLISGKTLEDNIKDSYEVKF